MQTMALRFDIGTLRPAVRQPNGALRADGLLTRSGVFRYRNADGTERLEYRPPDEVFAQESMDSFALVPVTNDHPPEMVNAVNARAHAVGAVGESLRRDGDFLAAALAVHDAATIEAMEGGKVELSCGYECDVDPTPGTTPAGEKYDAVQRRIRGNHVAIVKAGRAGPMARVRMDRMDAVMVTDSTATTRKDDVPMEEIEKLKAELAALAERLAALEGKAKEEGEGEGDASTEEKADAARADKLEAERDALKAQLAKEQRARKDEASAIARDVRARLALERAATTVLGADTKLDALTDREVRVAIVKKLDGADIDAAKSDDYVTARYDAVMERAESARASLGLVREALAEQRVDDAGDAETKARNEMLARHRDASKKKGN